MPRKHVMTAKRRAALKKAQLVSARKRRKSGGSKKAIRRRRAIRAGAAVGVLGAAVAGAKYHSLSRELRAIDREFGVKLGKVDTLRYRHKKRKAARIVSRGIRKSVKRSRRR